MPKIKFSILILLTLTLSVFAEEIGLMRGLLNPSRLAIYEEKIFVSDSCKIKIYSKKDLTLVREIGRKGEGPGEFDNDPRIVPLRDFIFAQTIKKISWFSRDGILLKEAKLPFIALKVMPVKENIVVLKQEMEGSEISFFINLCNLDLKQIKNISKIKFQFIPQKVNPFRAVINFDISEGRIIAGNADQGEFRIFDEKGYELKVIKGEFPRVKVGNEFKNKMLKRFKEANLPVDIKIEFPEEFPYFQTFWAENGRIYVQTFKWEKEKILFILIDMNGKEIKRTFLPEAEIYTIKDNFYYWLELNENEEYVLHRQKF